jgi:hypothetical protein
LTDVTILNPDIDIWFEDDEYDIFALLDWGTPPANAIKLHLGGTAYTNALAYYGGENLFEFDYITAGLIEVVFADIKLPETSVIPGQGGNVKVLVNTGTHIAAGNVIILAAYGTGGRLASMYHLPTERPGSGNKEEYDFTGVVTTGVVTYKVFIWESFESMKPII